MGTELMVKENPLVEVLERKDPQKDFEVVKARLDKLGFKTVTKKLELAKKLSPAYEKYMFVTEEKIQKFNQKLMEESKTEDKNSYSFKKLFFTPIDQYGEIPPAHVLDKIEKAQEDGIFDKFEVARIKWQTISKDPIVFGSIYGCSDYFFIAQWDDDVRFEDIVFTK